MSVQTIPYGLWPSPISPQSLAQGLRLSALAWDHATSTLLWLEGRSDRGVLVAATPGEAPRDLTTDLSVRARVGYGGGDIAAAQGYAYFISGGRIYRRPLAAGTARPLTPAFGEAASPEISPDGRWLLYVHSYEGMDGLAIVDTEGSLWPQKLAYGDDFYMQPTWHRDGQHIAWVSWNHPQMPWDGTTLSLATLDTTGSGTPRIIEQTAIAGGRETAIFQPSFSPDGRYLAYVSDASGWDNLYLYDLHTHTHRPLVVDTAELGVPAWAQGMRTYAWSADNATIHYIRSELASAQLWAVQVASGACARLPGLEGYASFSQIASSPQGYLAVLASGPRVPERLLIYDPAAGMARVAARSASESVPAELLSKPQALTWESGEGDEVYGLYYPPSNGPYRSTGLPPLIVMAHGGPTGQLSARHSAGNQFFTTRGYAVLDVNYRGSSGYGRDYRNKLREQWGCYDMEDVVSGARFLAAQGLVDAGKMVIMGGSAGGYTVLQSLIHYPGTFKAGICMYGVTNLFTLASDTHKLEQRYLDSLIGPLPDAGARYRERSPIFFAESISDPIAIFQGQEDRVVPMEQAESIVAALRRRGVPHEYHLYPGEGHGWRKSETIAAFYETVLRFLKQYVLFA